MFTFLITFVVTVSVYFGLASLMPKWPGLCITLTVLTAIASQIVCGMIVRRKLTRAMNVMTTQMQAASETLRRKYETLAQRGGNMKLLMDQAQNEEKQIYRDALDYIKTLEVFRYWALFFDRQLAVLRLQFYLRLKEYDKADALLKKALIADPMSAAMIIARHYVRGEHDKVAKLYAKYSKRFKAKGEILYALMAWIDVKENKIDEAIFVLDAGKKATGSDILGKNWEALVNNKVNKFSNAALQEQWYVLGLEEPKIPKNAQTQPAMQPQYRQYMSGKGRGAPRH